MPIRKIVTEKKVQESLNRLPDATSPVMDEFYPSAIRRPHPSAFIRIDEIQQIVKAVPVVLRGTTPVSIGEGSGSINSIEPQPIDIIDSVRGADLNNIKHFDGTSEKVWLDNRMLFARNTIRATSEALCIQSLSGQISFAMKTEDGEDTYSVKFGNVLTFVPVLKLNGAEAGVETLMEILSGMASKIEENGGGTNIKFKASPDVYTALVKMLKNSGSNSSISVKVGVNKITLDDDVVIEKFNHKYYDPATKTYKTGIAEKTLKAVAMDGGWAFRYLALDDIDAGLKPLPLYSKPIKREMASGWVINTMSKPLPIPNPNSICDAAVL